jgi:hypothetical protein
MYSSKFRGCPVAGLTTTLAKKLRAKGNAPAPAPKTAGMYTKGHEEILDDALRGLQRRIDRDERAALSQGLMYPDFPCGGVALGRGDSLLAEMQPCGVADVASLLLQGTRLRLSLGFQSHAGFYSLWHATTYDPDKSVANIARNACEHVLVCCSLAWRRRSLFWLGFALHIVMDAYSPAHVLREGGFPEFRGRAGQDLVTWLRMSDEELDAGERRNVERLRGVVRDVVRGASAGLGASANVRAQPRALRPLAAFALFEHEQRRRLPVRVDEARLRGHGGGAGRVMNFYYVPRQHGLFHATHDLISAVREAGAYAPCVRDVHDILRLYLLGEGPRRGHGQGHDGGEAHHVRFLRGVLRTLTTRTFAVHPRCADAETGFDVQRILSPTYRTLRFDAAPDLEDAPGSFRCTVGGRGMGRHAVARVLRSAGAHIEVLLPTVRNSATRPELVAKRFRFTRVGGARGGKRGSGSGGPAWLRYRLIEVHGTGLGYPVTLELASGARYAHPELLRLP